MWTLLGRILIYFARFVAGADARWTIGLWGSCDPTTWRADTLIPFLLKYGIKYFNPQRSDWCAEKAQQFAAEERDALDNVLLHFFVIDGATRALVSLFELYHVMLRGKPFVVVIEDIVAGTMISEQKVSVHEASLINKERERMRRTIRKLGLPVFSSINEAKWHIPLALFFPQRYRMPDIEVARVALAYDVNPPLNEYRISNIADEAIPDIFSALIMAYMSFAPFKVVFPDYKAWGEQNLNDGTEIRKRRLLDFMRLFDPYAGKFMTTGGRAKVEIVVSK